MPQDNTGMLRLFMGAPYVQGRKTAQNRRFERLPGSLLRFAHKTAKNRLQGDFLPCKLPKHAQ
jgi:hypothetical protein